MREWMLAHGYSADCSFCGGTGKYPDDMAAPDPETNAWILRRRLGELMAPIPSTKGMGPKDRADRLHAELQRRIKIAREAEKFWRP